MSRQEDGGRKTALVTGGSRGIGRAVAAGLARNRTETVIVNYLENEAAANSAREEIEQLGARCVLARANLAYTAEIDNLFEQVSLSVDRLDILVHCAALGAFKPLGDVKPNQWDLTMNINARAFLQCVQKSVEIMNGGSIVAVSSLGSARVVPGYGAMGPTKAALEATIRYLAAELAPRGIRVNGVSGGLVKTESIEKMPGLSRVMNQVEARTPAGRTGTPEDIANVVMFLVGPAAKWICGQTIVADGGYSLY